MPRTIHIGACALLATAIGCTQSYKPDMSTETGNPPVTIDGAKIALVVTRDEVHVRGEPGAVMPPEADVEITIVRTREVTLADVDTDGSFDAEVDATLDDLFEVRAILGGMRSDVVIVVRGGSAVIEGDGGGLSCEQQTDLGASILGDANETADRSCEVAADCTQVHLNPSCVGSCATGYFSDEGAAAIAAAIDAIDDGVCASFAEDGCTIAVPRCATPRPAACVDGQCVEDTSGGECDTCFSKSLTWSMAGVGILPALPELGSRTVSGCNTLEHTQGDGDECSSDVLRCPDASGAVSIASVLEALEHEDVVQAFEQGGTHGYAQDQSGFAYELTLDGETITYRTCAGMNASVSCDPPNGLDALIDVLKALGDEHSCVSVDPEPDCTSAFDGGDCDAAFQRWWHDPQTGACLARTYGGCGGNENNYTSEQACRTACPPPADSGACPPNRAFVDEICFDCGPLAGCEDPTSACLLVCSEDAHCDGEEPSLTIDQTCGPDGVCRPELLCD